MPKKVLRMLKIAALVPPAPQRIGVRQLVDALRETGFVASARSVQRDLAELSELFPLTSDEERLLKAKALIEGRKPNFFVAKSLAQQTGQKASYSKNLAFDKQYYLDLIYKAVKEHRSMSRKDIDELLWNKLPDWMDDKQRKTKVGNLVAELRRANKIANKGSDTRPSWALVKPENL